MCLHTQVIAQTTAHTPDHWVEQWGVLYPTVSLRFFHASSKLHKMNKQDIRVIHSWIIASIFRWVWRKNNNRSIFSSGTWMVDCGSAQTFTQAFVWGSSSLNNPKHTKQARSLGYTRLQIIDLISWKQCFDMIISLNCRLWKCSQKKGSVWIAF